MGRLETLYTGKSFNELVIPKTTSMQIVNEGIFILEHLIFFKE